MNGGTMTIAQLPAQTEGTEAITAALLPFAYEDARPYLATAVEVALACFKNVRDITVTRESDPEVGTHCSELRLKVHLSVEEAVDALRQFTLRWTAAVPWPEHNLILLSCDFV
jgi:hypothetical protein